MKIQRIIQVLLVILGTVSGGIKILGIRMDFMRVTQVGFDDWQITLFGLLQLIFAFLLAWVKTNTYGAVGYILLYSYSLWHYFAFDLSPIIAPIILVALPIVYLLLKRRGH